MTSKTLREQRELAIYCEISRTEIQYDVKRARDTDPNVNSPILTCPHIYKIQSRETRTNQIKVANNTTLRL